MKKIVFFSIAILAIILTGCPYNSNVPISEPMEKAPDALFGKWRKSADSKDFYTIMKGADEKTMKFEENTYSTTDDKYTHKNYEGWISTIEKTNFLNIREVKEAENKGGFYLYKIVFTKYEITLSPITEYVKEKFNSSAELKEFIKKNMNLSFFFGTDDKYSKFED